MLTNEEKNMWEQLIINYKENGNEHSMLPLMYKPILSSLESKGYIVIENTMPGYVMVKLIKMK